MASLQERMIGAIQLRVATFEEVENDRSATGQAAAVVVIVAVASAIGNLFRNGVLGLVVGPVLMLIGWLISAAVVWILGTKVLPGRNTQADYGEMLRVVGFAQSAGVFTIVAIIPFLGPLLAFLVSIWVLVAYVIGVRQGLDYDSTGRAIVVCLLAWLVQLVLAALVTGLGLLGAGAVSMLS